MIFLLCPYGFGTISSHAAQLSPRLLLHQATLPARSQVWVTTGVLSSTANNCPKSFVKSRTSRYCTVETVPPGYELGVWGELGEQRGCASWGKSVESARG